MTFKKLLMLGYSGNELDKDYLNKLDNLCEKKILIAADSHELPKHLDADALAVKFSEIVDKNLIDKMPNLKYVGTLATAYGRIDANYAARGHFLKFQDRRTSVRRSGRPMKKIQTIMSVSEGVRP